MTFGEKLRKYRNEHGMTQEELATLLSTTKQVISRYERSQRSPKLSMAISIAEKLNLPSSYLVDDSIDSIFNIPGILPAPRMVKKPRLGVIACGTPILAVQNYEDYDVIPESIECDFTLKCKGDSMINARIFDGDIVCIRKQPDVENGEIAAVLIDNEVTLKRVYKYPNKLVLNPENPKYEPFVYTDEELNNIRILGKATHFISEIK